MTKQTRHQTDIISYWQCHRHFAISTTFSKEHRLIDCFVHRSPALNSRFSVIAAFSEEVQEPMLAWLQGWGHALHALQKKRPIFIDFNRHSAQPLAVIL